MAVAIAGKSGSGKTTITKSVSKTLAWPRASFGDYVRKIVRQKGLPETRKNLQEVGTKLLEEDPNLFCLSVLSDCGWKAGESLVIDGLRHSETIDIIRNLVRPASLRIVFISVPEDVRIRRLIERGDGDQSDILEADSHSSEQQVVPVLSHIADLNLDGDRPREVVAADLISWIGNQQWKR